MVVSEQETMGIKSYQDQAEQLIKEIALSDPVMPYVSIIGGMFACKMVCSQRFFQWFNFEYHVDFNAH